MKKLHAIVFGAAMGASGLVLADTADITVSGVIKPGSCTPTLAGGGSYDFGTISTSELNYDRTTQRDGTQKQLSIACDAPTRFGLHAVDNKADSAIGDSDNDYGLGMGNSKKIGNYSLFITRSSLRVDNQEGIPLVTRDNGASWNVDTGSLNLIKNTRKSAFHSFAPTGSTQPVAVKNVTANLNVRATIQPAKDLDLTNDIQIDGASTLQVKYL